MQHYSNSSCYNPCYKPCSKPCYNTSNSIVYLPTPNAKTYTSVVLQCPPCKPKCVPKKCCC